MQETALDESCTEYVACLFVKTYDNSRYKVLNIYLDNKHIMGKYAYPNHMEEAKNLLDNYKVVISRTFHTTIQESAGVTFLQKRKREKKITDTEKDPQANKIFQYQCLNCRQEWDAGNHWVRYWPLLTAKYCVELKELSNLNVLE